MFVCEICHATDTEDFEIRSLAAERAGVERCEDCWETGAELADEEPCEACEWIDSAPNNSYYSEPSWARCEIEHTCE